MCCCGKPTINGEPGAYSWDGKSFTTRQPDPPTLSDGESLLYDCPGRCGGLDGHSFHFRLVLSVHDRHCLLVRHGAGGERIPLGCVADVAAKQGVWDTLSDDQRYWLLYTLYSVHRDASEKSRAAEHSRWSKAAAEKRIKTRKQPNHDSVKVWIEA